MRITFMHPLTATGKKLKQRTGGRGFSAITLVSLTLAALISGAAILGSRSLAMAQSIRPPHQGFGASTPGGLGGSVVHVTNLNDSGPGSLREALTRGNRTIVFDVAGEIALASPVDARGAFITIDGFSAPPPGITLRNQGIRIRGSKGAHDIVVRGIRVRNSGDDGIQVKFGAYNVVINQVSVSGSFDGNLDITEDSHDVTVSWSIFAEPADPQKNMLIKYRPSRVSLHHNILAKSKQRNPQARIDNVGTPATDTTLDMRNNLIWNWANGYGTLIWYGPRANVVNNFFFSAGGKAKNALIVCKGDCDGNNPASQARAYVAGNFSGDGLATINQVGTEKSPFPAPLVDTVDACTAARWAISNAGVRPLDLTDQLLLSSIWLPACDISTNNPPLALDQTNQPTQPTQTSQTIQTSQTAYPDLIVSFLSAPHNASMGSAIYLTDRIKNGGKGPADATTIKYYFSTDRSRDSNDTLLGSRTISPLAPGAQDKGSISVVIPTGIKKGKYYIIAEVDADGQISEESESNNTKYKRININ